MIPTTTAAISPASRLDDDFLALDGGKAVVARGATEDVRLCVDDEEAVDEVVEVGIEEADAGVARDDGRVDVEEVLERASSFQVQGFGCRGS